MNNWLIQNIETYVSKNNIKIMPTLNLNIIKIQIDYKNIIYYEFHNFIIKYTKKNIVIIDTNTNIKKSKIIKYNLSTYLYKKIIYKEPNYKKIILYTFVKINYVYNIYKYTNYILEIGYNLIKNIIRTKYISIYHNLHNKNEFNSFNFYYRYYNKYIYIQFAHHDIEFINMCYGFNSKLFNLII
jgi:hypothetical protein